MKLVTAIMPSRGRPSMAAQAVESFLSQTYEAKELIVLDDADSPSFPNGIDHPQIRYFVEPTRLSIGRKRNLLCEKAKGFYIAHFDDDDHSVPARLSVQIQLLESSGKSLCGLDSLIFYDPKAKRAGLWTDAGNCCGTSMVYRRDWWERHRFPEVTKLNGQVVAWGEDNAFRNMAQDEKQYVALRRNGLIVARAHSGNTNKKHMGGLKALGVSDLPKGFPR